ncbi:MAG: ATP-binding cassette domain-containing protein [Mycobacteriaceae bacterium]
MTVTTAPTVPAAEPLRAGAGPVIATRGLSKRYGRRTVVDSLDIEVPAGVVAGFIGPNGAGKTTTLRMLLGLVRPTAGSATVLGVPLRDPAGYLPRVGALIESPAFYPGLSGTANLTVQAVLGGHDRDQIPALLARVELGERGADAYKTYSLGMKQRLAIAAALLGDPDLLILDEPTNGLDPAGIRQMRRLVRSLAAGGPSVLISSHLLTEVQHACDWLIVIDRGRRVFQGRTAQLLDSGATELVLGCEHPADLGRLQGVLARRGLTGVRDAERLRVQLVGPFDTDETSALSRHLAELNRAAAAEGVTLTEITATGASLEDRYAALVTDSEGAS